ncbi:STY4528 family pathogenicity island replication protein [Pseudomonas aeruginosa]
MHFTPRHSLTKEFATPSALMLDPRLTPLERNGWQVLNMLKGADGLSPLPSYNQLRRYLTTVPLGQRAGFKTATRTLMVLRLTGWVSLVGQRCDPLSGNVLSELFQVHDTPVRFRQACALDAGYVALVQRALGAGNGMVERVANHVLAAARHDAQALALMPSELLEQIRRLPPDLLAAEPDQQNDDEPPSPGGSSGAPRREGADGFPVSPPATRQKDKGVLQSGLPQTPGEQGRPSSPVRTYKGSIKEVRTYRAGAQEGGQRPGPSPLRLPSCLERMAPDQHRDVQAALRRLPGEHRQAVLDELEARVRLGAVRNAVAYLFGLVRRVLAGEFRLWAAKKPANPSPTAAHAHKAALTAPNAPSQPVSKPAAPEVAQAHLAQARRLLGLPVRAGDLAAELFLQDGQLRPHPV